MRDGHATIDRRRGAAAQRVAELDRSAARSRQDESSTKPGVDLGRSGDLLQQPERRRRAGRSAALDGAHSIAEMQSVAYLERPSGSSISARKDATLELLRSTRTACTRTTVSSVQLRQSNSRANIMLAEHAKIINHVCIDYAKSSRNLDAQPVLFGGNRGIRTLRFTTSRSHFILPGGWIPIASARHSQLKCLRTMRCKPSSMSSMQCLCSAHYAAKRSKN